HGPFLPESARGFKPPVCPKPRPGDRTPTAGALFPCLHPKMAPDPARTLALFRPCCKTDARCDGLRRAAHCALPIGAARKCFRRDEMRATLARRGGSAFGGGAEKKT